MRKQNIVLGIIWLFSFYLIVNVGQRVWGLRSAGGRVMVAEQRLKVLAKEEYLLRQKLKLVNTEDFVEKEVRNKLHWVKRGEEVVLLPKNLPVRGSQRPVVEGLKKNWELWMQKLF